jgi:hypothetical protein
MTQKTLRNLPGPVPRKDSEHDTREAIIADQTDDGNRDLVHGDGGTLDMPTKPGDLSRDD